MRLTGVYRMSEDITLEGVEHPDLMRRPWGGEVHPTKQRCPVKGEGTLPL